MAQPGVDLQELIEQIDGELAGGDDVAKIGEARRRANALASLGDRLIDHFVTRARAAGVPWSQIGTALGVTRQAAQQRWTGSPFSRFTGPAKQAVVHAQQRAVDLRHTVIRPEHVLLGLLAVRKGRAARAIAALSPAPEAVRDALTEALPPGTGPSPSHLPFDPACKQAMVHAVEQAQELGDDHLDTEHLLLGLLMVRQDRAVQLLAGLGVDHRGVRAYLDTLRRDPA
jgi:hypothetical protein